VPDGCRPSHFSSRSELNCRALNSSRLHFTNPQAGGHLTPTSYPSHYRLRLCSNRSYSLLYSLGTDRIENTFPYCCSSIVAVGACFFANPLLSNWCYIFAYLEVFAQQRVYMPHYYNLNVKKEFIRTAVAPGSQESRNLE
jgi:hypothetical protein